MTRVRVDFNSRGPEGTVRGSRRRADGDFKIGDTVELFDPAEESMAFAATVADLDAETGKALFRVAWEPAPQTVPVLGISFKKATSWVVAASSEQHSLSGARMPALHGAPTLA